MTLEQALQIAIGYLRAGTIPSPEQITDLEQTLKGTNQ